MTHVYEFVGGPWDGKHRSVGDDRSEIHLHMTNYNSMLVLSDKDALEMVPIRTGLYVRARLHGDTVMWWAGEPG